MSRPTVSARRPTAALQAAEVPAVRAPKIVDDLAMKTFTSAMRRDIWRELNKLAVDQECTIQTVLNRAAFAYLQSQNYTLTVPLAED